jgi:monothiol glutaredoxin
VDTVDRIKHQIETHTVLLYMKGTPQFPMCGFSAHVVQLLTNSKANFAYVNVLEESEIRVELPKYANWPTFPQLWVQGELIGGCDIISELDEKDELLPTLQAADAISSTATETVLAE